MQCPMCGGKLGKFDDYRWFPDAGILVWSENALSLGGGKLGRLFTILWRKRERAEATRLGEIICELWPDDEGESAAMHVSVLVSHLKKALRASDLNVANVRGIGYMICSQNSRWPKSPIYQDMLDLRTGARPKKSTNGGRPPSKRKAK